MLLRPFSWLFGMIILLRRLGYRCHLFKTTYLPVPVIVVGNIVVGGTGKTPFVIWLIKQLKAQGYLPAIVTRGVGGQQSNVVKQVTSHSLSQAVGDEAILLFEETQVPVFVSKRRVAACQAALAKTNCNIIVSDDGLQHYALGRDMEIVLVDSLRLHGNGLLLPAGPLREPINRLSVADVTIYHGTGKTDTMKLVAENFRAVCGDDIRPLHAFSQQVVHAIAGIGHPQRFFDDLAAYVKRIEPRAFPDHYAYQASDLKFDDANPIIMTQKDAVKCRELNIKNAWFLSVVANIKDNVREQIIHWLGRLKHDHTVSQQAVKTTWRYARRRIAELP